MTAPSRPWSFGLRTLFVVVTVVAIFAGWLGWNAHRVKQRRAFESFARQHGAEFAGYFKNPNHMAPFTWRLFGAESVDQIELPDDRFVEADVARAKDLFPEATIMWTHYLRLPNSDDPQDSPAAQADRP